MADTTKIAWAGHSGVKFFPSLQFALIANAVGFVVCQLVAYMTQRNTIGNIKAEFGVARKWPDMVCSQVAASRIATLLASEVVALKHSLAPRFVFWCSSVIKAPLCFPVGVGVVILSTRHDFPNTRTNLGSDGRRSSLTFPRTRPPFTFFAHFAACFGCVFLPLERRYSSLHRPAEFVCFCSGTVSAQPAKWCKIIPSTGVFIECGAVFPDLTLVAKLLATRDQSEIAIDANASFSGGNFQCTSFGLSHRFNPFGVVAPSNYVKKGQFKQWANLQQFHT